MEQLLTLYSEVQSTDVRWLWYPFIAIGKITLLQGDPGDGKSTMMMNLIAELSTGGETPDSCKIGTPQKVIYQCSEDGVSDTIKPRLERCGADCKKIAFINEEVYNGLTLDDERIRQAIIEFRPRLVVIDVLQYTACHNENMKNGMHIAVNASAGYSVKHRAYGVCYSAGEQPHKPGSAYRGNGGFAGENNAPAKR